MPSQSKTKYAPSFHNDEIVNFFGGAAADFRTGSNLSDLLSGGDRNDSLLGGNGRDILAGGNGDDLLSGDNGVDILFGGEGNEQISGGNGRDILVGGLGIESLTGGNGADILFGDEGNDQIFGGNGRDILVGGLGIDRLTGGKGADTFVFEASAISDPSTLLLVNVGGTGINAKVSADIVTDFTFGIDHIELDLADFGVDAPIVFQSGVTADLADGNFIVQTDAFANVALAAAAIAANVNITADQGFFIYFNTTLGLSRLVYSEDLGDAGDVTVLANFANQTGAAGLSNIANFGLDDFLLI